MPNPDTGDLARRGFLDAPVALLVLRYRRVALCNRAAATLFGYEPEEIEGSSIRRLYVSIRDFRRMGDIWLPLLKAQGRHEDERVMQHRDGGTIRLRVRGRTLDRNDPFATSVWSFEPVAHIPLPIAGLTRREAEVLGHALRARTAPEIARMLGISPRTVETHRMRALHKMGCRTMAEASLAAARSEG